jgi:hypothetical protein
LSWLENSGRLAGKLWPVGWKTLVVWLENSGKLAGKLWQVFQLKHKEFSRPLARVFQPNDQSFLANSKIIFF